MKMAKMLLAAAVFTATASLPNYASASSITQDITTYSDGFTDSFNVTGLPKGSFNESFSVYVPSAGMFDIAVLLNESASGITSLSALLGTTPITLVKQGASQIWYGELSQAVSAGYQTVTLIGTANSVNKSISGSISFASATPEPAAWMLMIAGLGCIGGIMRRKRGSLSLA